MSSPARRPPRAAALNVHGEPSRLSAEQLARWQGLPLSWVDADEQVQGRNIVVPRPLLALLDAGQARARIRCGTRDHELHLAAGAMGLFSPQVEVHRSAWQCRDARRIMVDLDLAQLARRGLLDDDPSAAPLPQALEFQDAALAALLRRMAREVAQGCPNGGVYAETLSLSLVQRLFRLHGSHAPAPAHERGRLSTAQMARLEELVRLHLGSTLTLAAMAETTGFSKPHFVRLFRNTVGLSPHGYLLGKRAERALQLLEDSKLPLVNVAIEAGFAHQSHMNLVLRRRYGCTPGQARRRAAPGAQHKA